MNYDRNERIRRAAILVASLDERLAEQMLDNLPVAEAEKILAEVDRLGDEIDPEEQRDVLDEFRRAGRMGREPSAGVEFTYSAPQPMPVAVAAKPVVSAEELQAAEAVKAAEAALIAELLSVEHPQTIAVALSRMDHEQGAAVFAVLPPGLQPDVIDRLANLQITDEAAVTELQSELHQRIEVQRQRRERAAAGAEMARKIVSRTAPTQRDSLLARLSPRPAAAAVAPAIQATPEPVVTAEQIHELEEAVRRARELVAEQHEEFDEASGGFEAWADDDAAPILPMEHSETLLEDRSRALESLSDAALLRALQQADEQTVYRALACSSERFLSRVAGKLPRRAAAQLRSSVRSIGPTRLIELRAAQHQLLALAESSQRAAA